MGEKGVESEVQTLEAKENQIPKTKDHRLGVFSYSAMKAHPSMPPSFKRMINLPEVAAVAGTSTRAVVWWEGAQESEDQVTVEGYTPFLVAGSEDSDHQLAQSSQLPDRVLAAQCTDVDNDEESFVGGEDSSAAGRVVGLRLQPQSRRHEMQ